MSSPCKIIALVMLTAFLTGCQPTAMVTPREAFFQKHPNLRSRYDQFYETSPEAIAEADGEKLTFGIIQIHDIQKNFAKYPDLVESLDVVEKRLVTFRDEGPPIVKELENVFNPKTDALFWYDYGHGQDQGQGYMIVRNGEFYRTFWCAGAVKRSDEIP